MFKDFSAFNRLAHNLFKDEAFQLVAAAFTSFRNMLVALRTEAYDYATWYNKIMRDKYEDGAPVDITDLPYLSVPRSQLAVMRGRILKVKEAVAYAANAITNVALGWKVGSTTLLQSSGASISSDISITATTQSPILNAIKRIQYAIGDIFITFAEGDQSVTVNGVSINVSPLVRGTFHISKFSTGNNARVAIGSTGFSNNNHLRSVPGEIIRSLLKTPLVVARSAADLAANSIAPVGLLLVNRQFFNKRLIVWAESVSRTDFIIDVNTYSIFDATLHTALVEDGEVKSVIAASLYGYLSEDYIEAMSYNAPTQILFGSALVSPEGVRDITAFLDFGAPQTLNNALIICPLSAAFATGLDVYGSYADVSEATTQTAISDMFYTEQEWDDLLSSLSEA